jgi:hypothetical protein
MIPYLNKSVNAPKKVTAPNISGQSDSAPGRTECPGQVEAIFY